MPFGLDGLSNAETFHFIGWFLLVLVFAELGWAAAVMVFGDPQQSPLDRCATWMTRQLKDDDGKPLIEPWETPSTQRKVLSSLYFLGLVGVELWFAVSFMQVR